MTQEGRETLPGAVVDGPAGGGGQQSRGSGRRRRRGTAPSAPPGAHAARQDARPARQPPERGRHSRAAQLRSGLEGPARGEPTGREQRQEPNAEGRGSSIRARGCPVVTAGRDHPGDGVREDGRSARSEAREAVGAGCTFLGCTRDRASVGKVSALLSLQLRLQYLESAERERAPSREEAHPLVFSVHLRPCPWPLQGCSESLSGIYEKVRCLLQGERGGFI